MGDIMGTYREGDEPEAPKEMPQAQASQESEDEIIQRLMAELAEAKARKAVRGANREENVYSQFGRTAEGKERPRVAAPGDREAGEVDEVFTAVLLVHMYDGRVIPMTNIDTLKMHHTATPHEIFRMAADVQNQLSAVRIIGEILTNTAKMNQQLVHQVAVAFGVAGG